MDHRRTRTGDGRPWGHVTPKRSEREWERRARKRLLALPPEERIAHGTIAYAEPMQRTSKGGRNAKIRAYKREKRLAQQG